MIVVLAGLPGAGKSFLAKSLIKRNPSYVCFDKDIVREAIFPGKLTDFTSAQDDLCIELILQAAKYLLEKDSELVVLLDGRPFSKRYQVEMVQDRAREMQTPCKFIECTCSEGTAITRLSKGKGVHLAKNRDHDLYKKIQSSWEPLAVPHLTLVTDGPDTIDDLVDKVSVYLHD
ncbi:AAA family ATPase [Sediminispirochaeta smaragdinae]|uniref:Kinase n=1 Tax=Sediminispirochaeta smaragdinae (strain DSM 11293 / JCM 15392 / SEBR 4228) TaxID=573413 RepID=E1RC73_SEDSS|nr:AAA family ATPase [Sediminispirochaeta smaragdinae]ADK79953.1 conserved hypothetical protein [Sediminispirochaeta smaragdinae DSM 11293]